VTGARVEDLGDGLLRIVLPLPWSRPDHVHAYALEGPRGLVLVDAGLGDPGAGARWQAVLAQLGRPVRTLVVTHWHSDHAGGGADVAALTGCEVLETALDARQVRWWRPDSPRAQESRALLARHGCPDEVVAGADAAWRELAANVRPATPTRFVEDGEVVSVAAGEPWRAVALPGHADGQIGLYGTRSGRLLAADGLLAAIAPNIGVAAGGRPDPLGDFLRSLERLRLLRPAIAHAGHGEPVTDVAARTLQLEEHHAARAEAHRQALRAGAGTAYDVTLAVYRPDLDHGRRRLAVSETLAHLARLEARGEVRSVQDRGGRVRFVLET
jgi:glyoxylase-like metal-dependent hydrolase (beta-lactamase superfamily II)